MLIACPANDLHIEISTADGKLPFFAKHPTVAAYPRFCSVFFLATPTATHRLAYVSVDYSNYRTHVFPIRSLHTADRQPAATHVRVLELVSVVFLVGC